MIEPREISVVVQGAVDAQQTKKCLVSIRKYLPEATIILSTWQGSETQGLPYDKLVQSEDPGNFYYSKRPGERPNNVNRQIVSTLEGLRHVETRYALKIRTDFSISGSEFLSYWNKFTKFDNKYKVFQEKLLACCYFSRIPLSDMPFPFHPSDLAFFGLSADLKDLFDLPLMSEKEAYWDSENSWFNRYVPEQYIFINFLRGLGREVSCDKYSDVTELSISETEKYFASNFVFLTFQQFNLRPGKATFSMKAHPNRFKSCYTHFDWLRLYHDNVDQSITLPSKDMERSKINSFYKSYGKFRLLANLVALFIPSKSLRRLVRNFILEKRQ